eukprot:6212950-Prymnesium_polylepis.1
MAAGVGRRSVMRALGAAYVGCRWPLASSDPFILGASCAPGPPCGAATRMWGGRGLSRAASRACMNEGEALLERHRRL